MINDMSVLDYRKILTPQQQNPQDQVVSNVVFTYSIMYIYSVSRTTNHDFRTIYTSYVTISFYSPQHRIVLYEG